jgi:hypothetical protein
MAPHFERMIDRRLAQKAPITGDDEDIYQLLTLYREWRASREEAL